MEDKRVQRRGIKWTPRQSHVIEARRCVRMGIAIHPRWLPFLSPALRVRAILKEQPNETSMEVGYMPPMRPEPRQVHMRVLR